MRLRDPVAARVRYGYRRLHVMLGREGWQVNHNRTYRLSTEEGLSIRPKTSRRKHPSIFCAQSPPTTPSNENTRAPPTA
jgi:putative transposase